ncbi:MAG TPA: hypothetical protein VIY49_06355 [Bryobacteraceae bacterium]
MRVRFVIPFVAFLAGVALTQILFAQEKGKKQAKAPTPSNLPFDPHDISGIWRNSGGFDPVLGNDRPPMTDWGKEQWSKTRSSARRTPLSFGFYQDQKDWNDPLFECDPSGYPRNLDYSNYKFVKLPDEFVEFFERDRVWRDLWTDGRKLPGPGAKPRWYGYATAHWDGDTFVVESTGYDERAWIDPYGSIHSSQMRIEERYRRTDHDNLEFSMTLTDPKAYNGTWGGKKVNLRLINSSQQVQKGLWGKRPDGTAYGDIREEFCVYSIEHQFWQGRPLEGISGDDKK